MIKILKLFELCESVSSLTIKEMCRDFLLFSITDFIHNLLDLEEQDQIICNFFIFIIIIK